MAFNISQILEKMTSRDKDFRFMATHDLANEMEKEAFKIDSAAEPKIVSQLLLLLDDPANNVQENAVKCLGLMIKRVKEAQAQDVVDTLCNHMLNEKKDELREISNIGLKTVIAQLPAPDPPNTISNLVVKRLTPRLIAGVSTNEKPEVKMCCLDILNDMLQRFGLLMTSDLEKIQRAVLPQLTSGRPATRKRAISCLGHLAVSIPDNLFASLIDFLISNIEDFKKADHIRTLVQAVGAISRTVGYRLGKYLPRVVPLIVKYCDSSKFDQDDELRENCLQAFESLLLRCPKDITPFLPEIIAMCLKFIKYDPNYAAEEEERDGESMETDEENEDDGGTGDKEDEQPDDGEDDGGDISDDDDMSWKVRRAATKTLSAIITTRPELLIDLYQKVAPTLVSRFTEREENVKIDVFATFIDLLRQTSLATKRVGLGEVNKPLELLREQIPKIVEGLNKQLKEKSIKTRVGTFWLLKELVVVLPGSLTNHVASIVPGVVYSLGDKNTNSNLKIEALTFLRLLLANHPETAFHPHVKSLAAPIISAIGDHYYRITAEGLRVCCEFVRVIRPEGSYFDFLPYVRDLYQSCLTQLKAQDIDQEVKECAISCMGIVLATLGDSLQEELNNCLMLLLDRLRNEITRVTAVRALSRIATSQLNIDLSPILADSVKELSSFLRKSNRQLKQGSLSALDDIVRKFGLSSILHSLFSPLLTEVAPLISDADLHLSHLSLHLCVSLLKVNPSSAALIQDKILPQSLALLKSSLLQGLALESLLALFAELVTIGSNTLGFDQLLELLVGVVVHKSEPLSKQSLSSIAQCIAVAVAASTAAQRSTSVYRFVKELTSSKDDSLKLLSLLSLGEIGRRLDLGEYDMLKGVILASFELDSEEVKQAASFALGNVSVGSMQKYLPFVLGEIKRQPKRQYLLLHSLREIIVRQSFGETGAGILKPYLDPILSLLFENCESEEEGTRNVVAECLGKLALICPNELVPLLQERVQSPSAFARSTIITALKFTILESPQPIDALLLASMADFLTLLIDKDLNVRRVTLLTLNYAAHNKPSLIRDILHTIMPILYHESKVKNELIREVDLGPFKHKVDDGLEIRKAAFECMYTLLETSIDRLDISLFIGNLADGLKDHYDIKMLCHLMLIRLSNYAAPALVEGLNNLVEPLRQTVTSKVNESAVKQQVERNDELIRSALRAVAAIAKIPNVGSVQKFEEFLKQTILTGALAERYGQIRQEDSTQPGQSQDMMDTTS